MTFLESSAVPTPDSGGPHKTLSVHWSRQFLGAKEFLDYVCKQVKYMFHGSTEALRYGLG